MSQKMASANGLHLYCESFGLPKHPAVLLIMGNNAQAIMWPTEFCELLSKQGYFVIRYDNRDTGLSTCIDFDLSPYTLRDLAIDAACLLDALKIKKAHILGLSMGAAIGQLMAYYHPECCISLVCLMATLDSLSKPMEMTGKKSMAALPPPTKSYLKAIEALNAQQPSSRQEKIQQLVENLRLANGEQASFDKDYWSQLMAFAIRREESNQEKGALKFSHLDNHSRAQKASVEPNLALVKSISLPTLVVQGALDPIFPPPHGQRLADAIPHAHCVEIPKMGHTLNPEFYPEIMAVLERHFKQASTES